MHEDGSPVEPDETDCVAIAKAEYYLSKADKKSTTFNANSTLPALRGLCNKFLLPWAIGERKPVLVERLMEYYVRGFPISRQPDYTTNFIFLQKDIRPPAPPLAKKAPPKKSDFSVLGSEVVAEIKSDMERTTFPGWLKTPPINFATTEHGKLGAEEFKSLSIMSLPITLIRLWGDPSSRFRPHLGRFLHLSLVIRILAYQSITAHDIALFEFHYREYLQGLKLLYPFGSITCVQHLGLHIPYFLQSLGPSTRYSENTAEMFIGILQDIATNSRFGRV